MLSKGKYSIYIIWLIAISTVIRVFLAASLELGNDEVYYVLYAKYPDWSHFDHPLMVGLSIQLFTLNLLLKHEFFIRFASILFGAINIWLIYRIGKMIKNERTGFYAALLYVASIYSTIISGVFILPDTPQSFFWLISIFLMLKTLPSTSFDKKTGLNMLLLGLTLGLGILSKYTTVYLWIGIGLFVFFFRRDWFKNPYLYLAILVSVIIASPILIWNYQNNWISFAFQGGRVGSGTASIHPAYFIQEFLGEVFYNNPVNFIIITFSFIWFLRSKLFLRRSYLELIILSSLPLIATFQIISFFRSTLPHWTAPSYTTLFLLGAVWLDQLHSINVRKGLLSLSFIIMILIVSVGFLQVKTGMFSGYFDGKSKLVGENDPSLDMYGFKQTGKIFADIVKKDIEENRMPSNSIMIGRNWFPLANYDFYAASPLGMKTFGIGTLDHLHKYAWINNINGGFKKGMDAYYLTDSRTFHPPGNEISSVFNSVEPPDTIRIQRDGKTAKLVFVYRLKNLEKIPKDVLVTPAR